LIGDFERDAVGRHEVKQDEGHRSRDTCDTVDEHPPFYLFNMAKKCSCFVSEVQEVSRRII
jgi:hypothetical protein